MLAQCSLILILSVRYEEKRSQFPIREKFLHTAVKTRYKNKTRHENGTRHENKTRHKHNTRHMRIRHKNKIRNRNKTGRRNKTRHITLSDIE